MLRQVVTRSRRPVSRRHVAAAATGAATATATCCYYVAKNNGDSTLGLRRQGEFWLRVAPIVFDYYWNFASSSPLVRYQAYRESSASNNTTKAQGADEEEDESAVVSLLNAKKRSDREALQQELHERHAPKVLQIILDLKGLYVKLGQVLSVTALPIPETYRELFRTLQSDVPGYEEFERTVKPTLERELGTNDLSTIFSYIAPIPVGAASIGQAHRATLQDGTEVVIKIQYPEAAWQVPADIECVGHLLKLWVFTGLVDETAANLSFNDFSNQFMAELDYIAEQNNLHEVYQSSLSPDSPYQKRGIVIPKVVPELCTKKVITMSYLRGPKLEQEARRQLELLGIDTKRSIFTMVRDATATMGASTGENVDGGNDDTSVASSIASSWKAKISQAVVHLVGVNGMLWTVRLARRILQWSKAAVAASISVVPAPILPRDWETWSKSHQISTQQAQRLALTESWIDALFDVHGYQIFHHGLFNADCHPGNILVIEEDDDSPPTRLGLIDYGQCKRLSRSEQVRVARLILSVANKEGDEKIANAFRGLGVGTQNDSTEFLAHMARLMFGPIKVEYLDHAFHKRLHNMDRITYFPKDLAMVYRTSLLLRGLALSLQVNASVSEQWQSHAAACVEQYGMLLEDEVTESSHPQTQAVQGLTATQTKFSVL